MPEKLKIAIIGAGICGLYLGWKLSEKGQDVTIFEKRNKIGKLACSGLFSQKILKFIPQSQKLIQNKIDSVLIHFPKKILIKFSEKFFVISHCELDKLVASLAKKSGAKIVLEQKITAIPQGFDRIIGCDGPHSFVRKKLGLREPSFRLAIQGFPVKTQKEKRKANKSSFVEAWPHKNKGFIWKIPRGDEIEYGIIAEPQKAKALFNEFLKKNNLRTEKTKAGIVPQGLSFSSDPKITLCGDAAGLTKPWSGGGVIWGLIAAEILLKCFPDFIKYQKLTKRFFSPKILFSNIITRLVYFLGFHCFWIFPKNVKIEGDFLI
jgi:flavin-dependent dehydrogenase